MLNIEVRQTISEDILRIANSAKRPWDGMDWIICTPPQNYGNVSQAEIDRCLGCPYMDCNEECKRCHNNKQGRPAIPYPNELMGCIEQGLTNDEIAVRFNASKRTITRWKKNIRTEISSGGLTA